MAQSPRSSNLILDRTGAWLHSYIETQPWYKAHANTLTCVAGFFATLAAWAASQPFAADSRIQLAILIAGFLATVIGVSQTRNGFSPSQVAKIRAGQAQFVDDQAACSGAAPTPDGDVAGRHAAPTSELSSAVDGAVADALRIITERLERG